MQHSLGKDRAQYCRSRASAFCAGPSDRRQVRGSGNRCASPALPDVVGPLCSMLDSVEAAVGWPTPDDLVDGLVGRLG